MDAAALDHAEERRRSERERRFSAAPPAHAADTMRSMVVPVSPNPKRARLASPAPRELDEAWEQDEEARAKHRRVPPAWALEPAFAPVSSRPRNRVPGAAVAAAAAPDSQDAPLQMVRTVSDLSHADTPMAGEANPQEPEWQAQVRGELTLKSTADHRRAKRAGGAGAANRDPIDLTGESPQPLTARRQGTLSRANARVKGWSGGGEGASGCRPSRRSGQAVVVINDDEEDDESPQAAFAVESDDEGGRSTSSRRGRIRDLEGASGFRGARAEGKGEPSAPRRQCAVMLIDEGRGDKGKAPANERPAYAPARAAQGDRMQITSTVSRSFTCPICYDDVDKGG
jgi:hypothetical protein